jgi:hypothetical protein
MSNTKIKFPGRFWKGSKYIKDKYKEDLVSQNYLNTKKKDIEMLEFFMIAFSSIKKKYH